MIKKSLHISTKPGVYLFKDKDDQILYIGKAKSLRNRINSYFNNPQENKVAMIFAQAKTIETIPVATELEALHLEIDLIKKYQPKFNVLLKEGNPFIYILFSQTKLPTISIVRTKNKKGVYVGPFLSKKATHQVYNFLMETFKLKLCKKKIPHGCLQYHLGICAGYCTNDFDLNFYKVRFKLALQTVKNDHKAAFKLLDNEIKKSSKNLEFERSKNLLEYKKNFQTFVETINKLENMASKQKIVSQEKNMLLLFAIQKRLKLKHIPYVIDCFDISHLQANAMVGSCIRYVHAEPEPSSFRRFMIKTIDSSNDYAALQEIVIRRYKTKKDYPNLIIVDGGKGQINAIKPYVGPAELVGLAKREETIISSDFSQFIKLDINKPEDALILQIRDKTHQFAITYHRKKRSIK